MSNVKKIRPADHELLSTDRQVGRSYYLTHREEVYIGYLL